MEDIITSRIRWLFVIALQGPGGRREGDRQHRLFERGARLPGGRAIFSACDKGLSAEAVLTKAGLRLSETIALDPEHVVEMNVWRAAAEAGKLR